jgi:hypothetical protein
LVIISKRQHNYVYVFEKGIPETTFVGVVPSPQLTDVFGLGVVIIIFEIEIEVPGRPLRVQKIGKETKSNLSHVICLEIAKLLISPRRSMSTLSSEPEGNGGITGTCVVEVIEF